LFDPQPPGCGPFLLRKTSNVLADTDQR